MRLGITLSGGGARGIAHIGVLKALNEYGIEISAISGTSMGALVGVLYADGKQPEEILEIVKHYKFSSFLNWSLSRSGLIDSQKFSHILEENLEANSFEELKKELHVAATNLNTGEYTIFNSGELIKPVIASASIPLIFKPVIINGDTYVDGGLLNNLPIEPLQDTCDKIIGVHVNRNGRIEDVGGFRGIADRAFRIAIWQTVKDRLSQCDYVIEPTGVYDYGTFDMDKANKLFEDGYKQTEKLLIKMLNMINLEKVLNTSRRLLDGDNEEIDY